jgi:ABC-2 type transport system ATP-binding protein
MEEFALQIYSLSKSFGRVKAVNDINLTVRKGEILGLLGPNGSGKSTTMKMILAILRPDAGSILVEGLNIARDPVGVKRMIG